MAAGGDTMNGDQQLERAAETLAGEGGVDGVRRWARDNLPKHDFERLEAGVAAHPETFPAHVALLAQMRAEATKARPGQPIKPARERTLKEAVAPLFGDPRYKPQFPNGKRNEAFDAAFQQAVRTAAMGVDL
jgi:hypothetical protein